MLYHNWDAEDEMKITLEHVVYTGLILVCIFVLGFGIYTALMPTPSNSVRTELSSGLIRYEDPEAGVVCYRYNAFTMSCVPISETKLDH